MKMDTVHLQTVHATVYRQDPPVECGFTIVGGKRETQFAAQLVPIGKVTGFTIDECWRKAYQMTRLPVMEWVRP